MTAKARVEKTEASRLPKPGARLTRAQRYRKAAALLREWMADESGYDEQIAPLLERELASDPIRLADPFDHLSHRTSRKRNVTGRGGSRRNR